MNERKEKYMDCAKSEYNACTSSNCKDCKDFAPMNERKEEVKGKCQHKDCIHYGEVCCAMESECDGEEWYNKMPDGELVRNRKEEVKGDGEVDELEIIFARSICPSCNIGDSSNCYSSDSCNIKAALQSLISQSAERVRKEFAEKVIESLNLDCNDYANEMNKQALMATTDNIDTIRKLSSEGK